MPAGISSVFPRGKADGERTDAKSGFPLPWPSELVKNSVQLWPIGGLNKGGLGVVAEPNNGLLPGGAIARIAPRIGPEHGSTGICQFVLKRLLYLNISINYELLDVCLRQRGWCRPISGREYLSLNSAWLPLISGSESPLLLQFGSLWCRLPATGVQVDRHSIDGVDQQILFQIFYRRSPVHQFPVEVP